jgi:pimeloyl-ACP methyl ester carboxylesterase
MLLWRVWTSGDPLRQPRYRTSSKFDEFPMQTSLAAARGWGAAHSIGYSLADGQRYRRLMDALGLKGSRGGVSMGGMVAQLAAIIHPTRVPHFGDVLERRARCLTDSEALAALLGKPENPLDFASASSTTCICSGDRRPGLRHRRGGAARSAGTGAAAQFPSGGKRATAACHFGLC